MCRDFCSLEYLKESNNHEHTQWHHAVYTMMILLTSKLMINTKNACQVLHVYKYFYCMCPINAATSSQHILEKRNIVLFTPLHLFQSRSDCSLCRLIFYIMKNTMGSSVIMYWYRLNYQTVYSVYHQSIQKMSYTQQIIYKWQSIKVVAK